MNRADRKRWASARTLAGLGELTAQWLEGRIGSQPGYAPGRGPDPETEGLIAVLASCNRAGFVTDASQPGECGSGYDGAWWEQRAAVEGFASPGVAARLRRAVEDGGLIVGTQPASRWRTRFGHTVTVTRRNGRPYTRFGAQLSRGHLRDPHTGYGICHEDAIAALCAACRVTILDPAWGRNDRLWPALAEFARASSEELAS